MVTVVLVLIAWVALSLPLAMLLGPAFHGPEVAQKRASERNRSKHAFTA